MESLEFTDDELGDERRRAAKLAEVCRDRGEPQAASHYDAVERALIAEQSARAFAR